MGLNRVEQMIFDYVQTHRDERQFWQAKVQSIQQKYPDAHAFAHRLELEIWAYFRERAAVSGELRESSPRDAPVRVSVRGLAEYWIRLWTTPRPKAPNRNAPDPLPFD